MKDMPIVVVYDDVLRQVSRRSLKLASPASSRTYLYLTLSNKSGVTLTALIREYSKSPA